MLGGNAGRRTIGATEHDGAAHLAARHVERLGGGIDDVVDGLHGEIEGHEFDDRLEAGKGRTDGDAGEAMFGDGRVDHPLRPEFLEHALADLVGALIFADFLAHQEHVLVAAHFFGHGGADRLAHGHGDHFGAFRNFRYRGAGDAYRRRGAALAFGFAPWRCCAFRHAVRRLGRLFGAGRSHSASPITAIGVFTFTFSVPSGTRIAVSVPSSTASTSMVALSVSISAMHIAGLDIVADFFQPFGKLALFHGGRQGGHQNVCGMLAPPLKLSCKCRCRVPTASGSGLGGGKIGGFGHDRPNIRIDLLQLILAGKPAFESRAFTCSMGSRSSRIFCTSSLARYLAGSDMEWPR